MTKKEKFITFVEENVFKRIDTSKIDSDIFAYWEMLKTVKETEKEPFTKNGKCVLAYLQKHTEPATSNAIAEGMHRNPKTVSGALRKLVTDGYVEKMNDKPAIYAITDLGKTTEIPIKDNEEDYND